MKFIHDKANIEGDVTIGDGVSVWPFASVRGDEGPIIIGDNVSVQDNVVIHGQTTIGNNVTIGHGAIVHEAIIGNNVLIGIGSIILAGAQIGDWSIIAAGALVTQNSKIPQESVVMGIPGKVTRKAESKDRECISNAYKNYLRKIKEK